MRFTVALVGEVEERKRRGAREEVKKVLLGDLLCPASCAQVIIKPGNLQTSLLFVKHPPDAELGLPTFFQCQTRDTALCLEPQQCRNDVTSTADRRLRTVRSAESVYRPARPTYSLLPVLFLFLALFLKLCFSHVCVA